MENLDLLVKELINWRDEASWIELKHNNYDPEMIAKDICALANSASLYDKDRAYMIWGVDDKTHEIIGTDRDLQSIKKGNQELESWLRNLLSSNVEFEFQKTVIDGLNVGILIVYKAINHTVTFQKVEYIRVGSYTTKLKDHPQLEMKLWDKLRNYRFEEQFAKHDLTLNEALQHLNSTVYFDIKEMPIPSDIDGIAHYMLEEGAIVKQDNGLYAITNLGAVLFAKKVTDFDRISRKAIRVVQYKGNNRLLMLKQTLENRGYVVGFEDLLKYIEAIVPSVEKIDVALRTKNSAYPMIAIREIVGNALIHQDFTVSGMGPVIEIFEDRIEFTNPGCPLVDIKRIIDNPPKSRNEKLASLMRTLRICEELGTGWDKIVIACELMQLPAPKIEIYEDSTKVTLFSKIPFTNLSAEEKLWACYLHACIRFVQGDNLTNSSLRERFALSESSSGSISRLIKDAVAKQLIKPVDPDTAPRYMKYIPAWA